MSDESWRQIEATREAIYLRIAWARLHMTEFTRPTNAARSLAIKPGTYRTYEQPKWENGRVPPIPVVQQIARKYGVSWLWLLTGDGSPYDKDAPTPMMVVSNNLAAELEGVPEEKRDDAARAALSVIQSFKRVG